MLKPSIEAALNRQLNRELYSSYLYLAMSAYYDSVNLPGFSSWLRTQAKEELAHAMKFYDYLSDAGGRPVMDTIEAPPKEWPGPKEAFAEVVDHEKAVTGMIWALMDLAKAEKDHATAIFLQWFVTEQGGGGKEYRRRYCPTRSRWRIGWRPLRAGPPPLIKIRRFSTSV